MQTKRSADSALSERMLAAPTRPPLTGCGLCALVMEMRFYPDIRRGFTSGAFDDAVERIDISADHPTMWSVIPSPEMILQGLSVAFT